MNGFVIFTDLEKYSSLEDRDLKIYYDKIVPVIYERLKKYKAGSLVWNTWGDAIVATYDEGSMAVNMALDYRDIFTNFDFKELGIRKLRPRIAGHFGEFEVLFDKVSGKINMHGTNVNLAARIEPITLPGEIFVSKFFRDQALNILDDIRYDDMGLLELPKNAGQVPIFRLRRNTDKPMSPIGKMVNHPVNPMQSCIENGKRCGFKK